MKFDLNRAWEQALGLIAGNGSTVTVVAGVFFFIPYLALMLFMPQMAGGLEMQAQNGDMDAAMAAMSGFYARYWWVFVLMLLIQTIGMVSLIALLADRSRPTVGEAIASAVKLLPTYIAASLITGLAAVLVLGIIAAIGAASGSHVAIILVSIVAVIVMIYAYIKISLFTPVLALERTYNPIALLTRSWRLTKGNSFRLLLFYALLTIAFIVVSTVITLILGLVFGLFGAEIALVGNALVAAAINAAFVTIFLAVLAAIYRQLAAERVSVPPTTGGDGNA